MNPSKTMTESLTGMNGVATTGDLRRIVANSLLALARKEIIPSDVEAMAKGLDAISNSLRTEVNVARTRIEMREKGGEMGKIAHLGQMLVDGADTVAK